MSEVEIEIVTDAPEVGQYGHYYAHSFCCGNCGKYQHAYVRKGRDLTGLWIDCKNCGCYEKFKRLDAAGERS
jgi:hypothetical protein